MKNKATVGKLAVDAQLKKQETDISANEYTDEMLSDYEKSLQECIDKHTKLYGSDFYIVILTKKEKLLKNVLRNYFFGRLSCPTPNYDQVVYKYSVGSKKLEFLWVIPDKNISHFMVENKQLIDPAEWELLSNVLKFKDGSLFKLAKKLNGEKEDSSELN